MKKLVLLLALMFVSTSAYDNDAIKEGLEVISRNKLATIRKTLTCYYRREYAKTLFDSIKYNEFIPKKTAIFCGCDFIGNDVYFIESEENMTSFINTTYSTLDYSLTRTRMLINRSNICMQFIRITGDSTSKEHYFAKKEHCVEVFEGTVGFTQKSMAIYQWQYQKLSNKEKKLYNKFRIDTFRSIDSIVDVELNRKYITK